jgi:hypothetical protein
VVQCIADKTNHNGQHTFLSENTFYPSVYIGGTVYSGQDQPQRSSLPTVRFYRKRCQGTLVFFLPRRPWSYPLLPPPFSPFILVSSLAGPFCYRRCSGHGTFAACFACGQVTALLAASAVNCGRVTVPIHRAVMSPGLQCM